MVRLAAAIINFMVGQMEQDHLVVILERMESKLELVVEGHSPMRSEIQALAEKTDERFDLVDFKISTLNHKIGDFEQRLNQEIDDVEVQLNQKIDPVEQQLGRKIDTVAANLQAHRHDTEAHRHGYRVGEG